MRATKLVPAAVIGLSLATAAKAGPVDLLIVSNSVDVDTENRTATFTLDFDRAPNFAAGESGQADAFQYEIDTKTSTFENEITFDDISSVIRGSEIWEGKGLPIRARDGEGGDNSGGWGAVRDIVPFQIEGSKVSFTTTFDSLGEDDGVFRYRVIATDEAGGMTTAIGSNPTNPNGVVVPFPPGAWTGLSMLATMGIARMRSRMRKPRVRVM